MPIPTHIVFARPVLETLASTPDGLQRSEIYERMAEWAHLTPDERAQTIESGTPTYRSRVGWACSWLRLAGLVANPSRGRWCITPAGRERLSGDPRPFTESELVRLRARDAPDVPPTSADAGPSASLTPDERIASAVSEIHADLRAQLLSRLKAGSPAFFEQAVLKLLSAMGYGRFVHSGRSNDHGIDGVLYLDHLGLERVYVQAKRWENDVPRDRLQAFSGAMDEHHATKGVIVTTSRFMESARRYVPGATKIIHLIDGDELTGLMLAHGVGVQRKHRVEIMKLDEDFFEE